MFYHPIAVFRKAMTRASFAKMITNAAKIYFKAQGATLIVTHFPGPFLKRIALFFISKLEKVDLPHEPKTRGGGWAGASFPFVLPCTLLEATTFKLPALSRAMPLAVEARQL